MKEHGQPPKQERAPNGWQIRLFGRLGAKMANIDTSGNTKEFNSKPKPKIRARGETLIVSRGARLRPVEQYLHVAERAKEVKAYRDARSTLDEKNLNSYR